MNKIKIITKKTKESRAKRLNFNFQFSIFNFQFHRIRRIHIGAMLKKLKRGRTIICPESHLDFKQPELNFNVFLGGAQCL